VPAAASGSQGLAVGAAGRDLPRARRPKAAKLVLQPRLRAVVEDKLALRWSPQQIAGWLPAEAEDRAVPDHWEGNLLLGKRPSAVVTLAERASRYVTLVALPDGYKAEQVRPALAAAVTRAAPPVADLGPGQGDGRAHQVHGRHRCGGLFL
jgi:IS30 family transposase